jgi:hypothetical protein
MRTLIRAMLVVVLHRCFDRSPGGADETRTATIGRGSVSASRFADLGRHHSLALRRNQARVIRTPLPPSPLKWNVPAPRLEFWKSSVAA